MNPRTPDLGGKGGGEGEEEPILEVSSHYVACIGAHASAGQ